MNTAIDTNVISAVWTRESRAPLAKSLLLEARSKGGLLICGVVYTELCARTDLATGFVDEFLHDTDIAVDTHLSLEVWSEAGTRFGLYRERRLRSGGTEPRRLLPDFVIGAHALRRAGQLITFNGDDFRIYFPELALIP